MGFHKAHPQKQLVLVNPLPHSQVTQQWDGGRSGLGRKGGLAKPSKGHGPVSVPKGGARQQGHPVPLREGGEQAPLSHSVLSSILAKSKRENERGPGRNKSQPSPRIPPSALIPQLQLQGEWGQVRIWGGCGTCVGVCVCWGRCSGDVGGWKLRDTREEMERAGPLFLPLCGGMAGDP